MNPGSDPSSDPGSIPCSDPGSNPCTDPGFILSLSRIARSKIMISLAVNFLMEYEQ